MDTIKSKNDSLYWWKLDSLYVGNLLKTHTIELYSHLSLILLSPPSKKKIPKKILVVTLQLVRNRGGKVKKQG